MKTLAVTPKLLFIAALSFFAGCAGSSSAPLFSPLGQAPCTRFGPARIDVLPITSLVRGASDTESTINAYVCLLDSFDCQIKSPAVFRFELFQHVQHSSEPKGRRLAVWPDIDLTDPANNNKNWQDFLRAYLFSLPLQKTSAENSILHVTCLCSSGRRLVADFLIRPAAGTGTSGSKNPTSGKRTETR
jgi:hypothetical protein